MGTEDTDTDLLTVEVGFPDIHRARKLLESLGFKAIDGSSSLMEYDDFFKSSTGVAARFFSEPDGIVRIRLLSHEPSNEHDREKIRKCVAILAQRGISTSRPKTSTNQ